jgi:hypothetical protein
MEHWWGTGAYQNTDVVVVHSEHWWGTRIYWNTEVVVVHSECANAIHTHDPLFSSYIHPGHQDSLLFIYFSRTHPSSIASSIHCGVHLSLYLNISMWDLVLKDLFKRIQWCNQNLIWFFYLWVIIFFSYLSSWGPPLHAVLSPTLNFGGRTLVQESLAYVGAVPLSAIYYAICVYRIVSRSRCGQSNSSLPSRNGGFLLTRMLMLGKSHICSMKHLPKFSVV